jgi:hypothetical protein
MEFKTELKGADIQYWHLLTNLDYQSKWCEVIWEFHLEVREWGVKSMIAYAKEVNGEIELENGEVVGFNSHNDGWMLYSDIDIIPDEDNLPTSVQVNFQTKEIHVC